MTIRKENVFVIVTICLGNILALPFCAGASECVSEFNVSYDKCLADLA